MSQHGSLTTMLINTPMPQPALSEMLSAEEVDGNPLEDCHQHGHLG